MNNIKFTLLSIIGIMGGLISNIFGGWDGALTSLLLFMVIDYITGMMNAILFKKSPKTKNGTLSSNIGWHGISKKIATLFIVILCARLDMLTGTQMIKDCTTIAYIINEAISIIENVGLMGLPIPKVLLNIIDVLKQKSENNTK